MLPIFIFDKEGFSYEEALESTRNYWNALIYLVGEMSSKEILGLHDCPVRITLCKNKEELLKNISNIMDAHTNAKLRIKRSY